MVEVALSGTDSVCETRNKLVPDIHSAEALEKMHLLRTPTFNAFLLLFQYAIFLTLLLLLEIAVGVLGFVFKDWIKAQATGGFQAFITHYREDPDQQNLIDWIQEDWVTIDISLYKRYLHSF